MSEKVDYGTLLPREFVVRLSERPVAYLPLGTLEWHGEQNALGADYIQVRELFRRAARRFGGIVLPPLWVGPDRIRRREGESDLIGMDYWDTTTPHRPLPGSLYWIPDRLFEELVDAVLAQCARAGFRCVVADGHGPSRDAWTAGADKREKRFGLKLVSAGRDFPSRWRAMTDHAGRNETSIMMATNPDLVDLARLPADRGVWPQGVAGEDPRDATAAFGEELLEETLELIGGRLDELGI